MSDKMNYKEAFLESASGYMMPFSVEENEEVKIILPYGEQMHPTKVSSSFTMVWTLP